MHITCPRSDRTLSLGNMSIRITSHRTRCRRPNRTLSLEIPRSAQLRIKWTSSEHAWIALFPWKYIDLHDCAASAHQGDTPGSHYFLGNTSIRTTAHQPNIRRTLPDRTLSLETLQSTQLRTNRTSSEHTRIQTLFQNSAKRIGPTPFWEDFPVPLSNSAVQLKVTFSE